MKKICLMILTAIILLLPGMNALGQAEKTTYIEIILDASDTMKREVGTTKKLDAAKEALTDFINNAPPGYKFALRVMGGDPNASAYQSQLVADMGYVSKFTLIDNIQKLEPGGQRALYNALFECTYDFKDINGDNIAIVITDGLDDTGQAVSGLVDTYKYTPGAPKLYIFGLDITQSMIDEFNLLVQASGGAVANLTDPTDLKGKLGDTVKQLGANLSVYLYDDKGVPLSGDIVVKDATGVTVQAAYNASSLVKDLPKGVYSVEAKYRNETQNRTAVEVGPGMSKTVTFTFFEKTGTLRITLVDSLANQVKGYLVVKDMADEKVFEGGPDSTFLVSIPEGVYDIEAGAGGQSYQQGGITVTEGQIQDMEITIPIVQSILEVEVNNTDSLPINAHISVRTTDGFLIGEAQSASYYQTTVPPDTYDVTVEVGNDRYEKSITLSDGDQQTLNFDVDVKVGYLTVYLRTDSGRDAWGLVKVYDSKGQYQRSWSLETDEQPDWTFELPEGTYRVEAEVEGITSSRDNVLVQADNETKITITFPDYIS
jgi:hypothetical protein